ncbi:hypothetical protein [Priestia aryabhattai]|uniref:hypothetical protein n=1 Tax=Priestia aryabhattai TaxID=412384 RepID=UPI002E1A6D2E|nr:hypothetical protein [Priestia aryabhattai]
MNENLKWYAEQIEEMDLNVCSEDSSKFQEILNKALKEYDPENEFCISENILNMPIDKVKNLFNDLLEFNFGDELI